ncbi:MAG: DegT/DnrJ/EryC1/StrS family aminotransferase [Bacteroidales bacterium]|nr:DegT/DnrJ/EryC1/StrS family aminotransferase [Bacteroidales bacterium]
MVIDFYGLKKFYEINKKTINEIFNKNISNGQILNDNIVNNFENYLAEFCNRKYCVTFSSCTDALICAGDILNLRNKTIYVPVYSFIASASAFKYLNCKIIFYDLNPFDFTINFDDLENKLSTKEKNYVVVVHLYGYLNDFNKIETLKKKYDIEIIEDFAQSLGAKFYNKPAGSLGLISCTSFDPSKIIHAFGTGGALLTDDEKIYNIAKRYRYHGKNNNDFCYPVGFNSRITSYQAELLLWQLSNINTYIAFRNQIAQTYQNSLSEIPQISFPNYKDHILHTFHKFVIFTEKRDELRKFLKEKGIETNIHYPRLLIDYSLFKETHSTLNEFNIGKITSKILSLPIYPHLSDREVKYIVETIKQFYI